MKTKEKLKRFGSKILDILFPRHIKCIFCGEELTEKAVYDTCYSCLQTLPFIHRPCARCGVQIEESYSSVCHACNQNNRNFAQAKSVLEYTDKVLALVHRFKYNSKHFLAEPMVKYMAETFATWDIFPNYICDVPMFKTKLKKKGKNHSTILATTMANMFNITYLPLCEKIVDNPSQTTLKFSERQQNVKDVYAVNKEYLQTIKGKTILIIDDVITTCATVDEISKTLLSHGARQVYALSFARTPMHKEDNK